MLASIFEPPLWVGVLIAILSYVFIGAGLVFALMSWSIRRDRRRRVARQPRPERAARVMERDAATNTRPHGGVLPECFALDRAERRDERFTRPRLEVVRDELRRRERGA